MSDVRQEAERLCGCGYARSLHVINDSGGVYCLVARLRHDLAAQEHEIEQVRSVLNADLKIASERVLTLELESQHQQQEIARLRSEGEALSKALVGGMNRLREEKSARDVALAEVARLTTATAAIDTSPSG